MARVLERIEEFYAAAIAIERDAAERYREFALYYGERGEEVLAGLCGNLARLEGEHLARLLQASAHLRIPEIPPGGFAWPAGEAPETAAREALYGIRNPRQVLEVALHDEQRAADFFRWAAASARDEAVRSLAREMAAEEEQHVRWLRHALEYRTFTTPAA